MRDYEPTTYVSSFGSIDAFGPMLRQDALRRGLAKMGRLCLSLSRSCWVRRH
jgi:hypothetical protein